MAGNVIRIAPLGSRVAIYLEDGNSIEADCVVVAAGVWTRELLHGLGVRLLLDAHRGYNVSTIDKAVDLTHPLIWEEQGFGITPCRAVCAQPELWKSSACQLHQIPGGQSRFANCFQRLSRMSISQDARPGWARPMTPDTLPIIGAVAGHPNIYAATGHGHLGSSMAAVTGRIVADLVSTGRSEIDVAALSPNRFSH